MEEENNNAYIYINTYIYTYHRNNVDKEEEEDKEVGGKIRHPRAHSYNRTTTTKMYRGCTTKKKREKSVCFKKEFQYKTYKYIYMYNN